jgi:protein-tyrosine-phosphatase
VTGTRRPVVLFVCVHNAGRSQIARAWFEHLAQGRAVAYAGGSEPATAVNPAAVAVMREAGIDIGARAPARWTDAMLEAADVVVTMGCGDACPVAPGTRYEDWPVPDPAGRPVAEVRAIRDEIRARVEELLRRLTG